MLLKRHFLCRLCSIFIEVALRKIWAPPSRNLHVTGMPREFETVIQRFLMKISIVQLFFKTICFLSDILNKKPKNFIFKTFLFSKSFEKAIHYKLLNVVHCKPILKVREYPNKKVTCCLSLIKQGFLSKLERTVFLGEGNLISVTWSFKGEKKFLQ